LDQLVLVDIADGIATVTLNRPEVMNAIDVATATALREAIETAEKSDARVLLLTGSGRAFCAGGDVSIFSKSEDHADVAERTMAQFHPAVLKLAQSRLPSVAAIHGAAAGAGISLMLACDFAVAAARTRFTLAYPKIGASLDGGASWFLPRLLGTRKAKELAMLSETFDASTAERLGLVNRIVPDESIHAEAKQLARQLMEGPGAAYAEIKRLIDAAGCSDLGRHLEDERATLVKLANGHDFAEGIAAYLTKRKPNFLGK
jgi:2-(1,2-epoxy-1,2-dihydrophenyl)acetyl-CoA isomerase